MNMWKTMPKEELPRPTPPPIRYLREDEIPKPYTREGEFPKPNLTPKQIAKEKLIIKCILAWFVGFVAGMLSSSYYIIGRF